MDRTPPQPPLQTLGQPTAKPPKSGRKKRRRRSRLRYLVPLKLERLCRGLKVPMPSPGVDPAYGPAKSPWKDAAAEMAAAVERIQDPGLLARARDLGFPELHHAAVRGDVEVLEALLNAGLAPDMYPCTEDGDDEPPLVWLAQHREGRFDDTSLLAVAMLLLDRGAAVDEGTLPALHYAAELEDEEMMTLLLGAGAHPASRIDT